MPDGLPVRRGKWPAHPVIYQIYPRSFADTTGSGEGDLAGIAGKLDHLADLGADAVWIGPVYPSPMYDGGYDVADYCGIDPRYGTLADLDRVIARAHDLDVRIMMDLVFNHTSIAHPWFKASAARRDGMDDWYVWADAGPDGALPSNWQSYFGSPAWRWHEGRGQYYYHTFSDQQPKLNLRHDGVRDALAKVCAFWRARGVEGFRMDAVTSYLHDPEFRDNPKASPEVSARVAGPPEGEYKRQDHVYDFLPGDGVAFMRHVRDWAGPDTYLLGEVNSGNQSVELATDLVGPDGLDSAYVLDVAERGLTGTILADMVARGACRHGLAWWFSTHDQARHVTRAGDGSPRDAAMFGALLTALPGPLIVYQGEEAGQPQAELPHEVVNDPFDLRFWPDGPGREAARVPLAWTQDAPGYGFTTGSPWLPMATTGLPESLAAQRADDGGSTFNMYRHALRLRKALGLADGGTEILDAAEDRITARLHRKQGPPVVLALNMTHTARPWADLRDRDVLLASTAPQNRETMAPRSTLWLTDGAPASAYA